MPSFAEIAERHGAALLLQYGSTVAGPTHAASDVDIGVLYDAPPPSLLDQGALVEDLQRSFAGRQVDLATLDRADPLFLKKVLERCRLLAGSPRRLAELKVYAFKRYQDHRRYLPLERAYVDRVLAEVGR
jgi:predicted nucleotidyltransferase